MSYSPATIANYFLEKASAEGRALTPMQLLKMTYIAHGWHLGFYKEPLIDERVEAWRYGPVIPSLYRKVKRYGSGAVSEPLTSGPFPWDRDSDVSPEVSRLLDRVWDGYAHFGGIQLSEMTHMKGSPWWYVWNEKGGKNESSAPISDALIQAFYERKIEGYKKASGGIEVEEVDPAQHRRFTSDARSVAEHA